MERNVHMWGRICSLPGKQLFPAWETNVPSAGAWLCRFARRRINVSPKAHFLRSLMLLLVMLTVGIGQVRADDVPFEVTTDPSAPHYYLIQSYGNTGFFMRQNIETTTASKSDVVTTLNILTDDMKWYFLESGEDGYYYICDINNKYLYFAKPSGSTSSRTWMELKALDDNNKDNYKFSIAKNNTNGTYNIIPKGGNTGSYCLNKRGRNSSDDGIQILAGYNDENSCWFFIPMSSYKWTLRSDCFRVSDSNIRYYYKIKSQQDASYYIKPGTDYVQTSSVDDNDMIWFFEEAGSDELMTYYYIRHANTEKYLHYNSTSVGQPNAIDLAPHTGNETVDDEARFQFIVVRGTNENELLADPKGIVFNIVPKLLKSTSSDVSIKSVSCDGVKGNALKTKSDRKVNTTHWSFELATFSGAWADPEITCDATGTTGTVTITCSDADADIYYTTNGDTPTATDTETNKKYTAPFTVNPVKTTIKARVIESGKKNSNVVTKTIVLNPTITLSAESFTYTGSAQNPVSSVDYVDATNSENNINFESTQYAISYKKGNTAVDNCTDAGEYTIILNDVDGDEYFIYGTREFTIGQKDLTITAKPKEITYGEGPANDGVTYDGFAGEENETVLGGTLAYAYNYSQYGNVSDAEHIYTITPSSLTSTNYNITFVPGTLKVNPKEVGLTWSTPTSFDYDGAAHALTASATGVVNDDAIAVTVTTSAKEGSSLTDNAINAGSYTAIASALTGEKAGNYSLPAENTQAFTIGKRPITISGITANDKTYDGNADAELDYASVTYGNIVTGETLTVSAIGVFAESSEGAGDGKNVGTNKTVTITSLTLGGTNAGNYVLAESGQQTTTAAAITAKEITANGTIAANNKTYDGSTTSTLDYSGVKLTDKIENDDVSLTAVGTFDTKDVGTSKTVSISGITLVGDDAGNYTLTSSIPTSTTADITAKVITASGDITASNKPYDGNTTATLDYSGVTLTDKIENDDVLLTAVGTFDTKDVGTSKTVSISNITLAGDDAGNYTLTSSIPTSTTAAITAKEITASGNITANDKPYDGNRTATLDCTVTLTGKVENDDISFTATGIFDSKDVGTDKTVTITPDLAGADASNYSLVSSSLSTSTTANITPASLTITANDHNITYGSAPENNGVIYSGFVGGEDENTEGMFTGALTYVYKSKDGSTVYTTTIPHGEFDIIPGGLTAGNYDIAYVAGTLTVGSKSLESTGITIDTSEGIVKDGETVLTLNVDYTVTGPTTSGRYTSTVYEGIGNYTGTVSIRFANVTFMSDGSEGATDWSATFVADGDHAKPTTESISVYVIESIDVTNNTVNLTELDYIPNDVPVLLISNANHSGFLVKNPTSYTAITDAQKNANMLKKSTGQSFALRQIYLLYNNEFVLNIPGTLEAGKIYLENPNYPYSSSARLRISRAASTGISGMKDDNNTDNLDDRWFTIDGRRLNGKPTKKGLYILNDEKVVIK